MTAGPTTGYSGRLGLKYMPGTNNLFAFNGHRIFLKTGTGAGPWYEINPGTDPIDSLITDMEFTMTTPGTALFSTVNLDHSVHIYKYHVGTDTWGDLNIDMPTVYDSLTTDIINDMSVANGDTVFMLLYGRKDTTAAYQTICYTPVSAVSMGGLSIGHRFNNILVSPNNSRVIYGTNRGYGINFFRSTNKGITFPPVKGNTHDDATQLTLYTAALPGDDDGDVLFGGTDGGVTMKKAGSVNFESITGDSLCIAQFYGLANTEADDGIIEGGSQDNGGYTYIRSRSPQWMKEGSLGGDNYLSKFARKGVKTVYTNLNPPQLASATFSGTSVTFGTSFPYPTDIPGSHAFDRSNNMQRPHYFDENNLAYVGYRKIWSKTLAGSTWDLKFTTPVNDTLTPKVCDIIVADNTGLDTAYVALRGAYNTDFALTHPANQKLFLSVNASVSPPSTPLWIDITDTSKIKYAPINDIEVAPRNAARLWVAYGAGFMPIVYPDWAPGIKDERLIAYRKHSNHIYGLKRRHQMLSFSNPISSDICSIFENEQILPSE